MTGADSSRRRGVRAADEATARKGDAGPENVVTVESHAARVALGRFRACLERLFGRRRGRVRKAREPDVGKGSADSMNLVPVKTQCTGVSVGGPVARGDGLGRNRRRTAGFVRVGRGETAENTESGERKGE